MARAQMLGTCTCPECGFPDAEIRPDKGGNPYRFCPDCTAQYFSRGVPHKVKNLLAQVRAMIAPPIIMPPIVAAIIPVAALKKDATEIIATPAKPARKAFCLGDL